MCIMFWAVSVDHGNPWGAQGLTEPVQVVLCCHGLTGSCAGLWGSAGLGWQDAWQLVMHACIDETIYTTKGLVKSDP